MLDTGGPLCKPDGWKLPGCSAYANMQPMFVTLSRWIVRIFFREIVMRGQDQLPASGSLIFTPNHPNALLDPLLMTLLSPPYRIRFVAKAPLFRIPVFGAILRHLGAIPVVRRFEAEGQVDYRDFFAACVRALQEGDCIVIFPEGRSLSQPYLAPMKTGPARLFLLAREQGIRASLVPVALNYEHGSTFRSAVSVLIAPPIQIPERENQRMADDATAVHELTTIVGQTLDQHVFQAETYRDRELMLLLERLGAEEPAESWDHRLSRLKQFEGALSKLRHSAPREIENLRRLLSRYHRLTETYGINGNATGFSRKRSVISFIAKLAGFMLAGAGAVLNWIPYRIVDLLVHLSKPEEVDVATFKVVASFFLFPLTYIVEMWGLYRFLGWVPAIAFGILIVPVSLFTLRFFERREQTSARGDFIGKGSAQRKRDQLSRLRSRILSETEKLASRLE
jgi:glycerol-3-phosphate O-acyltransferase / dihydroxyacetone phosphate acyltransferase